MGPLSHRVRVLLVLLAGYGVAGCGLAVPDIKEAWDADKPAAGREQPRIPAAGQIEFEIKRHVVCELEKAVQYVNSFPVRKGPSPDKLVVVAKGPIPRDWIAQISLSLEVDESSALTPGVTFNTVLPNAVSVFGPGSSGSVTTGQSRTLGLGGTLSSTATRIDKFNPSYTIASLMAEQLDRPDSPCKEQNDPFRKMHWEPASSSPFVVEGNLGIQDWLLGAMLFDILIPSRANPPAAAGAGVKGSVCGSPGGGAAVGGGGAGRGAGGGAGAQKTDAVSYEIKFIIVSSGNVTPTWKLVNISANSSGTLFAAGRTRTHDLIITIGPNDACTLNAHLASEIGQAVSGANGARLAPQQ